MKRKKKTKLQKSKDDHNSIYWRKKADALWSDLVRKRDGNVCAICGEKEKAQAHHLIDRSQKATRHELWNGISLCPKHHKWDRLLSAHHGSIAFAAWIMVHRANQYEKVLRFVITKNRVQEYKTDHISWRDDYNRLMKDRDHVR